jgi:two-component system NtrC family sensor kinase
VTATRKAKPRGLVSAAKRASAQSVRAVKTRRTRAAAPLPVPDSPELLAEVLELSRRVTVDWHEDEIVHAYVTGFSRLFPRRLFCVRLFSEDDGALSSVYATGRLHPSRRDRLELSAEASQRHMLEPDVARKNHLHITDAYTPLFSGAATGFDIPLLDGRELLGLVSIEYVLEVEPAALDRALLVQLSVLFASALKNARSHRRSIYLRDYLGKLLDHANAPIMVMGKHGEVRLANRAFLGLLSFQRDELMGREWMAFLPEAEQRNLWPIYINALRGEPTTNVEVRLPRRDGSFARVAVNAASILGPDGEVEGVIYIYRDITEVRELEQQIIHAEKLATLGQLAAGVVHELNNPLTSICVYSDYLLRKHKQRGSDEGDTEKLRRIAISADRMLKFTRDLVTYARPSAEPPAAVSMHEVVEQAVVFCAHVLEECGGRIEREFEAAAPLVYGVKAQLVQVLINLITNACHAMPIGAGIVRFQTHDSGDGRLLLRVSDNGRGIPEEHQKQIFEPFFTTKSEGQGTGLGLSIVRNILEQHRGEVRVISRVGAGTTFEITLACRPDSRDD